MSRGRIDKRRAILDAAFTVFAREGYHQACVKEIAAEAGVAKPTVYNHLGDKEGLFREAMAAAADRALAESLSAIEALTGEGDVRATLEDVGHRLLRCQGGERAWALRRLLYAEIHRFPELFDTVHGRGANRLGEALANRLARLSLGGGLRAADPDVAAGQFLALLTGPMETRSRLGTRPVADAELRAGARAAVDTFLRAFGPAPEAGQSAGDQ
ncbi:TetR/AcrR family transcriptional regulator [Streptomyces sp. NPDC054796]